MSARIDAAIDSGDMSEVPVFALIFRGLPLADAEDLLEALKRSVRIAEAEMAEMKKARSAALVFLAEADFNVKDNESMRDAKAHDDKAISDAARQYAELDKRIASRVAFLKEKAGVVDDLAALVARPGKLFKLAADGKQPLNTKLRARLMSKTGKKVGDDAYACRALGLLNDDDSVADVGAKRRKPTGGAGAGAAAADE